MNDVLGKDNIFRHISTRDIGRLLFKYENSQHPFKNVSNNLGSQFIYYIT